MAEDTAVGLWPIVDTLLRHAANPSVWDRPRDQAELIYQLGDPKGGYWDLPPAHQQEVVSRLINLVPRIAHSREPKVTLERLLRLWHGPNPFESIARALRVAHPPSRQWTEEERLYRTDGYLQHFTDWCSESDSPIPYLWWSGVVTLAAACGYRFYIDRNADYLRLGSFYLIFTGPKGSLKSVGLNAAKEVLGHLNHQVYPWTPGSELPNYHEKNPFAVRLLPNDTNWRTIVGCLKAEPYVLTHWMTAEELDRSYRALVDRQGQYWGQDTGCLLLDELGVLFGRDNFAVDRIVHGLNDIYGGNPYNYRTQSGGVITLQRPALVLAGCCPPDIMQHAVTPLLTAGGLMDRTVVVYDDREVDFRYSTPEPRDPLIAAELARHLITFTRRLRPLEMAARPDAVKWFDRWFHGRPPPESHETSKPRQANLLWRTAGYIALSRGSTPWIEVDDFARGADILDHNWERFGLLSILLEQDEGAKLMDYLEGVLLKQGAVEPGYMLLSQFYQVIRAKRGLSPPTLKAKPFLESLQQAQRIRIFQTGEGRKRAMAIQLTRATGEQLRARRNPTDLPEWPVRRLPEPQRQDDTASHEPQAGSPAPAHGREPEPE